MLPANGSIERLVIAFLDGEGRVLGVIEEHGEPASVSFPMRRIIAEALLLDASGLLIGHNHPSGDPTPSRIDVDVTLRLAAAAQPLGLVLHDHLIRAADDWRSLRAMDLL